MQSLWMVNQIALQIGCNSLVNGMEFGQKRLYAAALEILVRPHAHPARYQYLAIGNGLHHLPVTILRGRVEPMRLAGGAHLMRLVGEVGVAEFLTLFPVHYFPVLKGDYKVIGSASEMGADRGFIVGDKGKFHGSSNVAGFVYQYAEHEQHGNDSQDDGDPGNGIHIQRCPGRPLVSHGSLFQD